MYTCRRSKNFDVYIEIHKKISFPQYQDRHKFRISHFYIKSQTDTILNHYKNQNSFFTLRTPKGCYYYIELTKKISNK